jgi:hypothetical protein
MRRPILAHDRRVALFDVAHDDHRQAAGADAADDRQLQIGGRKVGQLPDLSRITGDPVQAVLAASDFVSLQRQALGLTGRKGGGEDCGDHHGSISIR